MSTIHQNRITKRVSFFLQILYSFLVKPRFNVNNGNSQVVGFWTCSYIPLYPLPTYQLEYATLLTILFTISMYSKQTVCVVFWYLKKHNVSKKQRWSRCGIKWVHGSNPMEDQFISRVQCFAFYFLKHNSHDTNQHSHSFCTCFVRKRNLKKSH